MGCGVLMISALALYHIAGSAVFVNELNWKQMEIEARQAEERGKLEI